MATMAARPGVREFPSLHDRPISRTAPPHHRRDTLQHRRVLPAIEDNRRPVPGAAASLRRPVRVRIYCNGDRHFKGKQVNIAPHRYGAFGDLLTDLTGRLPNSVLLAYGVRQIFTPTTGRRIRDIAQLKDGGDYVCAGFETFKQMMYGDGTNGLADPSVVGLGGPGTRSRPPNAFSSDPATADDSSAPAKVTTYGLQNDAFFYHRHQARSKPTLTTGPGRPPNATTMVPIWASSGNLGGYQHRPKVITIIDGSPGVRPRPNVKILLNRLSVQSFEHFVRDVADAFSSSQRASRTLAVPGGRTLNTVRLFSVRGREILGISDLFRDDDIFISIAGSRSEPETREVVEIFNDLYPGSPYAEALAKKFVHARRRVSRPRIGATASSSASAVAAKEREAEVLESRERPVTEPHENGVPVVEKEVAEKPVDLETSSPKASPRKTADSDEKEDATSARTKKDETVDESEKVGMDKVGTDKIESEPKGSVNVSSHRASQEYNVGPSSRIPRIKMTTRNSDSKVLNPRSVLPPVSDDFQDQELAGSKKPDSDIRQTPRNVHRLDFDSRNLAARDRYRRASKPLRLPPLLSGSAADPLENSTDRRSRPQYSKRSDGGELENPRKSHALPPLSLEPVSVDNEADGQDKGAVTARKSDEEKVAAVNTSRSNNDKSEKSPRNGNVETLNSESVPSSRNVPSNDGNTTERLTGTENSTEKPTITDTADAAKDEADEKDGNSQPTSSSRSIGSKDRRRSRELIFKTKLERQVTNAERVVEAYEPGKTLGDGNFAVVKTCRHKLTGREYAMKVIDKSKLRGKEGMIENEIAIMKACNHVNIVRLYEEYETKAEIYLIMELIKGGDLFDAITQSVKFDEPQAARMVSDMTQALFYLHNHSIVHRDLKPENVLVHRNVDGSTTLKLADFGLALEVQQPIYTICGTPTYVAPEILAQTGYGLEIDMWALGVILYILLCGFPPFRSADRKQTELFQCIKDGAFEFLSPYWDGNSKTAKKLISHLLVVNRHKRYTAIDVLSDTFVVTVGGSAPLAGIELERKRKNVRTELEQKTKQDQMAFKYSLTKHG